MHLFGQAVQGGGGKMGVVCRLCVSRRIEVVVRHCEAVARFGRAREMALGRFERSGRDGSG